MRDLKRKVRRRISEHLPNLRPEIALMHVFFSRILWVKTFPLIRKVRLHHKGAVVELDLDCVSTARASELVGLIKGHQSFVGSRLFEQVGTQRFHKNFGAKPDIRALTAQLMSYYLFLFSFFLSVAFLQESMVHLGLPTLHVPARTCDK